ncbi:MAG: hypothetical protein Q7T97_07975 [Burkholderiaceae bacterium]|nr:hypothetical protein [Burkholderiaceae bacterium]
MASQWRAGLVTGVCALGLIVQWAALPMRLEQLLQLPLENLLELKVAPIRMSHIAIVQVAHAGGPPAVEGDDAA